MAHEMETYYQEQLRLRAARGTEAPKELGDLEARIARLRERLERGDPDLTPDELLAAIEKAEGKRTELIAASAEGKVTYKLLARLNKAAALYRQQIVEGLAGDPRAAAKARVILRELFSGEIRLQPQSDGGLLARWNLHPAALLKAAGTCGSGGRICILSVPDFVDISLG